MKRVRLDTVPEEAWSNPNGNKTRFPEHRNTPPTPVLSPKSSLRASNQSFVSALAVLIDAHEREVAAATLAQRLSENDLSTALQNVASLGGDSALSPPRRVSGQLSNMTAASSGVEFEISCASSTADQSVIGSYSSLRPSAYALLSADSRSSPPPPIDATERVLVEDIPRGTLWPVWINLQEECKMTSLTSQATVTGTVTAIPTAKELDQASAVSSGALHCTAFQPTSTFVVVWMLVGCSFIAYDIVMIPLMHFELETPMPIYVFEWFLTAYWSVDLVLAFFIGYETDVGVELRKAKIARRHLFRTFPTDGIAVGLDWAFQLRATATGGGGRLMKTARALKVFRVLRAAVRFNKIVFCVQRQLDSLQSQLMILFTKVLCTLVFLLTFSHYSGCHFYLMGVLTEENRAGNWLKANDLLAWKPGEIYTVSLYWALAQSGFASVNVNAINCIEHIYASVISCCWLIILPAFVSSFTVWSIQLWESQRAEKVELFQARAFLSNYHVSKALTEKIVRIFRRNHAASRVYVQEIEITFLRNLSEDLMATLHKEMYLPKLHWLVPLETCLHEKSKTSTHICHLAASSRVYEAQRDVFVLGQEAREAFFVVTGEMDYFTDPQGSREIHHGAVVAEAALWLKWTYCGSLSVRRIGDVVVLDVRKFLAIIKDGVATSAEAHILISYALRAPDFYAANQSDIACMESIEKTDSEAPCARKSLGAKLALLIRDKKSGKNSKNKRTSKLSDGMMSQGSQESFQSKIAKDIPATEHQGGSQLPGACDLKLTKEILATDDQRDSLGTDMCNTDSLGEASPRIFRAESTAASAIGPSPQASTADHLDDASKSSPHVPSSANDLREKTGQANAADQFHRSISIPQQPCSGSELRDQAAQAEKLAPPQPLAAGRLEPPASPPATLTDPP